jgi:serine/threonine-protein kinase
MNETGCSGKPCHGHLPIGRLGAFGQAVADNEEALKRAPDDARILNNLAWLWATCPDVALRDPARAVEMAREACALGEDAARLDTLAAGHFEEEAAAQARAIELADEGDRADFEGRLALYRAGQAYVQAGG